MDINQYGFSRASELGQTLSAPLDRSISNIKSSLRDTFSFQLRAIIGVIQLVWYSVIGAITFIPYVPFWVAGRVISPFASSKINFRGLHYKPMEIDLNPVLDTSRVDLNYLKNCIGKENIGNVGSVIALARGGGGEPQKQYAIFVKAIIKKMMEGNLTQDQKVTIVKRLAEATTHCFPTSVETAGKIYFELYGGDDVDTKILRMVQDYKESIILEILEVDLNYSQWHVLNHARAALGSELGLDKSLVEFDGNTRYWGYLSPGTVMFVRDMFYQRYANVNHLVEAVQTRINMSPPKEVYAVYSEILKQIAKDNGLRNEPGRNNIDDFVTTQCFNEDYSIKSEAVNMILRKLDIIK